MADQNIWFGTEGDTQYPPRFEWLPCPKAGMTATRNQWKNGLTLDSGGYAQTSAPDWHLSYEIEVFGEAQYLQGLDVYNRYASGMYGNGKMYFANPMEYSTNLFPSNWASPGMMEKGWASISAIAGPAFGFVEPNFSPQATYTNADTASVAANGIPDRSVTVTGLTTGNNFISLRNNTGYPRVPYCIIPVPPGYNLSVGWTGSVVSGTGAVRYSSTPTGTGVALTPIAETSSTRLNTILTTPSSGYYAFWLDSGATSTSSISINNLMAQLYPATDPLPNPLRFIPGMGHTGLVFNDDARTESYSYLDGQRHLKGMSTSLSEVGAWTF